MRYQHRNVNYSQSTKLFLTKFFFSDLVASDIKNGNYKFDDEELTEIRDARCKTNFQGTRYFASKPTLYVS